MKINKNYLRAAAFIAVYLFAIYLWTLPIQDNKMPYGEWDAISHWGLADFIEQKDTTFVYLPPFLDASYGQDNKYKSHTLWYPPPFHTNMAIMSELSSDRIVPIYLTNAVFATAILISVFFVINRLYGFLTGIISSFILTFSLWDIMPYLWGQWPERFGYSFIPLILYCFYMYFMGYVKNDKSPKYRYLMALLLAINLFIHPLTFFHSLVALAVLGVVLVIKEKKIPFNLRHIGISVIILVALLSLFPYQTGNVIVSFFSGSTPEDKQYSAISRIFQWAPNAEDFTGSVPPSYFSFGEMIGIWLLPFLFLGILVLVAKRENRDLFLLAWLISLYLVLHRDLIGKFTFLHRSLSASGHILIPVAVAGTLSLPSLIRIPKFYKTLAKYGLGALLVGLALFYSLPNAYPVLGNAYDSPVLRLNPAQVEVSNWLRNNVPPDQNVSVIGPPTDLGKKIRWMGFYSYRPLIIFEGFLKWDTYEGRREEAIRMHLKNDYVMFDYTDIALFSGKLVNRWQQFEQQNMKNHTLLYNRKNIRVYKYENT